MRRRFVSCCLAAFGVIACGDPVQREQTGQNVEVPADETEPNATSSSPVTDGPSSATDMSLASGSDAVATSEVVGGETSLPEEITSGVEVTVPDSDCYVPEPRPIPEPSNCATTVSACQPGSDQCLNTSLTVSIKAAIFESCDVYCGELQVGASQGCITLVEDRGGHVGDFGCVQQQLLGTRWDCAPSDGMVRIYLGSCTLM